MIPTQDAIEELADRIERAYRRRYPRWTPVAMTAGPWETAAARLIAVASDNPLIPVDPELLIAAQPQVTHAHDPWGELAGELAVRRYLRAVRRIVGQLREELRQEVRAAERRLLRGVTLDQLLETKNNKISPLTRFILAHRAGRDDLSSQLRAAAESQHRSCPLYRLAARAWISVPLYPTPEARDFAVSLPIEHRQFSLN